MLEIDLCDTHECFYINSCDMCRLVQSEDILSALQVLSTEMDNDRLEKERLNDNSTHVMDLA